MMPPPSNASRDVSARDALTKQVSNYSHKVWWPRAQAAREIAQAIQEQVTILKESCAIAAEAAHDELSVEVHQACLHAQSYQAVLVQLQNLELLLHHVPLTSPDQEFVMACLKSTCIHLRQIELWAGIHSRPGRRHGMHWQALVDATQKFRVNVYAVIGQPGKAH